MTFIGSAVVLVLVLALGIYWATRSSRGRSRSASLSARRERGKPRTGDGSARSARDAITVDARPLVSAPVPEQLESFRLITASTIDQSAQRRVDVFCADLAEPHPMHRQLARSFDDPEELAQLITSDSGLTARVLRIVNSAAFALASPITSVQHATTYLGTSLIRGLVAEAAMVEQQAPGTPEQEAALSRIWLSARTASAIGQLLAAELRLDRPSVVATKALFFNLGDVALVRQDSSASHWYTAKLGYLGRMDAQQRAFSLNAALLGAALLRRWDLPQDIASAVEHGPLLLVTPPASHPMQGTAYVENVLLYVASRIGDAVSYEGVRDPAELELHSPDAVDTFFLAEHLRTPALKRLGALLEDRSFQRKAARLTALLGPARDRPGQDVGRV